MEKTNKFETVKTLENWTNKPKKESWHSNRQLNSIPRLSGQFLLFLRTFMRHISSLIWIEEFIPGQRFLPQWIRELFGYQSVITCSQPTFSTLIARTRFESATVVRPCRIHHPRVSHSCSRASRSFQIQPIVDLFHLKTHCAEHAIPSLVFHHSQQDVRWGVKHFQRTSHVIHVWTMRQRFKHLCIDEEVEILIGSHVDVVHVVFTCRRDTLLDASWKNHTCRVLPFKQVFNPIRVTCTCKSSCINSMGSKFLWPVITQ